MALAPRCYTGATGGNTAAASFSLTYSGWTNAGGPAGTAPATGDIVVIVGTVIAGSITVSQSAGTGTWTFGSTGDNFSGNGATSFWAYRVITGTDTAPTFSFTSNKWSYSVIALAPDASTTAKLDTNSAVKASAAGTSFTPNSATAATTGECSLILNTAWESSTGANTIAVTAPSGWTNAGAGSGYGGATGTKSNLAQIAYQTGVGSGSVAPGAETIKAGTSGSVLTNVYQVLVEEFTSVSGTDTGSGADTEVSIGVAGSDTGSGVDTGGTNHPQDNDTGSGADTAVSIGVTGSDTGSGADTGAAAPQSAAKLSNSFEEGTNGVAVSPSNSGSANDAPFDSLGGSTTLPVYSTSAAIHGSLGVSTPLSSNSTTTLEWKGSFGGFNSSSTPWFMRDYFTITSLPPALVFFMKAQDDTVPQDIFAFGMNTTGNMIIRNRVAGTTLATGATAVTTNTPNRWEAEVSFSGTVYTLTMRCFYNTNAEGTTPDETLGPVTVTSSDVVDVVAFGAQCAASETWSTVYHDDIGLSSVTWLGPVSSGPSDSDTGSGTDAATSIGVSGSDTGSGADAAVSIGVKGFDTVNGADTAVSIGVKGTDTGSGSETGSVTSAAVTGAETGSGADTGSSIGVFGSDTGSGADAATSVGVSGSDTGSAAENSSVNSTPVSDSDTFSGADTGSVTSATVAGSDTASGADTGTIVASVSGADTGSGADAATSIGIPVSDTGSATDTGTVTHATVTGADTVSGADAAVSIRVTGIDTGSGVDTAAVAVSVIGSDTISGDDEPVSIGVTGSDTGSGADTETLLGQTTTGADTGSGVDAAISVGPIGSDTGSGADTGSVTSAAVSDADTGSGTSSGQVSSALIPGADTGTGADTGHVAALVPGADTGTGADTGNVLQVHVVGSDSSSAADTGTVGASPRSFDSASGADTGTVSAGISGAEVIAGIDVAAVAANIPGSDTGSGADAAVSIGPHGADTGAGTDTSSSITAHISGSDIGAGLDTGVVYVFVLGADIFSGADNGLSLNSTAASSGAFFAFFL